MRNKFLLSLAMGFLATTAVMAAGDDDLVDIGGGGPVSSSTSAVQPVATSGSSVASSSTPAVAASASSSTPAVAASASSSTPAVAASASSSTPAVVASASSSTSASVAGLPLLSATGSDIAVDADFDIGDTSESKKKSEEIAIEDAVAKAKAEVTARYERELETARKSAVSTAASTAAEIARFEERLAAATKAARAAEDRLNDLRQVLQQAEADQNKIQKQNQALYDLISKKVLTHVAVTGAKLEDPIRNMARLVQIAFNIQSAPKIQVDEAFETGVQNVVRKIKGQPALESKAAAPSTSVSSSNNAVTVQDSPATPGSDYARVAGGAPSKSAPANTAQKSLAAALVPTYR